MARIPDSEGPPPDTPVGPPVVAESAEVKASSGGRLAFRGVRRQISDEELSSAAVLRLLLDDLDRAEADCDRYATFAERYHDADKRAAVCEERMNVLREQLKTNRAVEVLFATGLGLGSAIIGLVPYFFQIFPNHWQPGVVVIGVGVALILTAVLGRTGRL